MHIKNYEIKIKYFFDFIVRLFSKILFSIYYLYRKISISPFMVENNEINNKYIFLSISIYKKG